MSLPKIRQADDRRSERGHGRGDAYLDLDYRLDLAADVDFNVVMTDDERFVEVQGTAEGEPYDRNELDWMLELAATGVRQIVAAQRQVLANVHV
ncbi:MAG: hypothetical protein R3A10_17025 [Caldilineaceae bacterium]